MPIFSINNQLLVGEIHRAVADFFFKFHLPNFFFIEKKEYHLIIRDITLSISIVIIDDF